MKSWTPEDSVKSAFSPETIFADIEFALVHAGLPRFGTDTTGHPLLAGVHAPCPPPTCLEPSTLPPPAQKQPTRSPFLSPNTQDLVSAPTPQPQEPVSQPQKRRTWALFSSPKNGPMSLFSSLENARLSLRFQVQKTQDLVSVSEPQNQPHGPGLDTQGHASPFEAQSP